MTGAPTEPTDAAGTPPVGERGLDVGGLTMNLAESGSGDPVLLLHGFPDTWHLWRHQIPALAAAGRRVLAPDLRGYGETDKPADVGAYAMPTLVADVVGLLDALDVDQVDLVGHDWGAALAWSVTAAAPDRVRRLAAISVGHGLASADAGLAQRQRSWYMLWFLFPGVAEQVFPRDDWALFRAWAWNGARPGEEPDADRQVESLSRPGALTAALNWYRANIDPVRFARLAAGRPPRSVISCPVMGVWSSDDPFLTEAQMTGSGRYLQGSWRYERIDGVDHWVPVRAPERLNELLLDFLA
jgi:pimeloyl-ACP methyl ester carboxylesterase